MMQNTNDIYAIRHFNRFYTKEFGFLQKRLLGSDYSLVEARVLYEIANRDSSKAADISASLSIDPGYLSRILKKFEAGNLIVRTQSRTDARSQTLDLTTRGSEEAAMLAEMSNQDITHKIKTLNQNQIQHVVTAMQTIEETLDEKIRPQPTAIIRSHKPGDIGWVIYAHASYYSREHQFNENFEALVTRICADFISNYDPKVEHFWIAEINGQNVGSVALVRETESTAKLRLLYIDETARGFGLGKKLVNECIRFAKRVGYKHMELWTNAALSTARHIYENEGFYLVSEDSHSDFGVPQVGQHWRLDF
jgi:DNA-binding MarR family transcriptional regulator/GNAT superfamily N-acetyltransferase